MTSSSLSRASFGMQCFWGAEALFGSLQAVHTTRVGYAGGSTANPTYRNLADHIETVDIEFDSTVLSYHDLLGIFFKSHDPTKHYKRQYISAIFYHELAQKEIAERYIKENDALFKDRYGASIATKVIRYESFTNAEDYHQKYFLRKHKSLIEELKLDNSQIINSPAAARLNGFCAGFGNVEQVREEVTKWKLSNSASELLCKLVTQGPNLLECGI